MIHKSKVINGMAAYIENEIVSKMAGSWKAWVFGSAAALAVAKAGKLVDELANNPVVQALGVIQGENVDIDAIYTELLKQAQKSSMTIELPVVGPVTFGVGDVESLYRYIKGA